MTGFWAAREPRERVLIGIAAAMLGALLIWLFAVKPLLAYPGAQEKIAQKAERELQIAKSAAGKIGAAQIGEMTILAPDAAISMITSTAAEYNLRIARRQPAGENGWTVWLEDADSRMLYGWIEALTSRYNLGLVSANISRNSEPTLRAQLVFEVTP